MLKVYGIFLQTRHNLKGGKFEGIRDDEAEGLEAELAPLASDSLKYGLAYCLPCDTTIVWSAAQSPHVYG